MTTKQTERVIELWESWPSLSSKERARQFRRLSESSAEDLFLSLDPREQAELIVHLPEKERLLWLRVLPPDDAADVIQQLPKERRQECLELLDHISRSEVTALLAYEEDEAGGLMNPRFLRVRPDMSVDEAIGYLRKQAAHVETIYYLYVLDPEQRLLGVLSVRELFQAPGERRISELMRTDLVTVPEDADQEIVGRLYVDHDLLALPVVDADGRMKGIVTFDDIAQAIREEQTEDIQRFGGMEALETAYLKAPFGEMVRKRGGWLSALFVGELLTTFAMGHFQAVIAQVLLLALFIPLIISSGGNSGSQASTLVIRAMALGEVHLGDWWSVARREVLSGLALGSILGALGFIRIVLWQALGWYDFGPYYLRIGATVAIALLGVVMFGTLAGSMLPFLLRRVGFDPASASAPFVATLVDVTGLVIYFSVAGLLLGGVLL